MGKTARGSNRDLVLLFAFAGRMPGVPFSCAAALKGFFLPVTTVRAICIMSCCEQNFVGPRGNSDIQLLQKVNAQDGACHGGLQKGMLKRASLKLDDF